MQDNSFSLSDKISKWATNRYLNYKKQSKPQLSIKRVEDKNTTDVIINDINVEMKVYSWVYRTPSIELRRLDSGKWSGWYDGVSDIIICIQGGSALHYDAKKLRAHYEKGNIKTYTANVAQEKEDSGYQAPMEFLLIGEVSTSQAFPFFPNYNFADDWKRWDCSKLNKTKIGSPFLGYEDLRNIFPRDLEKEYENYITNRTILEQNKTRQTKN